MIKHHEPIEFKNAVTNFAPEIIGVVRSHPEGKIIGLQVTHQNAWVGVRTFDPNTGKCLDKGCPWVIQNVAKITYQEIAVQDNFTPRLHKEGADTFRAEALIRLTYKDGRLAAAEIIHR